MNVTVKIAANIDGSENEHHHGECSRLHGCVALSLTAGAVKEFARTCVLYEITDALGFLAGSDDFDYLFEKASSIDAWADGKSPGAIRTFTVRSN